MTNGERHEQVIITKYDPLDPYAMCLTPGETKQAIHSIKPKTECPKCGGPIEYGSLFDSCIKCNWTELNKNVDTELIKKSNAAFEKWWKIKEGNK